MPVLTIIALAAVTYAAIVVVVVGCCRAAAAGDRVRVDKPQRSERLRRAA